MYNLFLLYFVNLYMFRAYLGPSSGGTTVCMQQLVLIILCCPGWIASQFNQDNRKSSKKNNNCVKKNQLDAQLFLSIFHEPLHVSGISSPINRRYNRMYIKIGTYYSFKLTVFCPIWIGPGHQTVN